MSKIDAFALPHSDLNPFLFAAVGLEASGNQLSVLSAFARLGIDPWVESGRLASLPQAAAIAALAKLITTLPGSVLPFSDAAATAARLVILLPGGRRREPDSSATRELPADPAQNRRAAFAAAFLAAMFVGWAANILLHEAAPATTAAAHSAVASPGAEQPAAVKKP